MLATPAVIINSRLVYYSKTMDLEVVIGVGTGFEWLTLLLCVDSNLFYYHCPSDALPEAHRFESYIRQRDTVHSDLVKYINFTYKNYTIG